ncbi:hypothetical protein L6452_37741 [Arctium lappa]|uniref:Uncharacterized protein n=1 Tax=Arctium lappa TaxID=4217 RepID=A0ACB8Y4I9_ARCLA|nr:hypothetical protein L6452_37741 [Arctium lappa]
MFALILTFGCNSVRGAEVSDGVALYLDLVGLSEGYSEGYTAVDSSGAGILAQVYVPIKEGDKYILSTCEQPYLLDQMLDGYREVSRGFTFFAEVKPGEYLRIDHAHNHEVQGSIALPVFEDDSNERSCCAALELVTMKEKSDFCEEIDHYARQYGLNDDVAIRLRSTYTGDDDYILEFFLPINMKGSTKLQLLLNNLSSTMQSICRNLRTIFDVEPSGVGGFNIGFERGLDESILPVELSRSCSEQKYVEGSSTPADQVYVNATDASDARIGALPPEQTVGGSRIIREKMNSMVVGDGMDIGEDVIDECSQSNSSGVT